VTNNVDGGLVVPAHGTITFGADWPARGAMNTTMTGAGTYTIDDGWRLVSHPYVSTIPTVGGLVRNGTATTAANGNWSGASATIRAELNYNVIAVMAVEPTTGTDPARNVGTAWVKNK
jgi:hypothetical protein